jgi:hypothetical protein
VEAEALAGDLKKAQNERRTIVFIDFGDEYPTNTMARFFRWSSGATLQSLSSEKDDLRRLDRHSATR